MGANPSQEVTNVNNVITKNIMNFLTNMSQKVLVEQNINVACSTNLAQEQIQCFNQCQDRWKSSVDQGKITTDQLIDICNVCKVCVLSNVNWKQTVVISQNQEYQAAFNQDAQSSLTNDLKQFQKDGNTNHDINEITNQTTENIQNIVTNILSQSTVSQNLNVYNVKVTGINFDQTANIVQDQLSSIQGIQQAVSKVANNISQTSITTLNWLYATGGIIIIIFILIFGIVTMSKSKGVLDFLHKTAPVIIFFVLALMILIIHLLVKPTYVTYIDPKTQKKMIDRGKLLMWLFIYYLGLFVILWVIYYVKRRFSTGSTKKGTQTANLTIQAHT